MRVQLLRRLITVAAMTLVVSIAQAGPTGAHSPSGGGGASVRTMARAVLTIDPTGYPWPAQSGWIVDGHGYWEGECTSFAAWAVRDDRHPQSKWPDNLGNANQWSGGAVVGWPRPGDVAQWAAWYHGADSLGHVAYVAAVNADGTLIVAEYNWYQFHRFDVRLITRDAPSRYLRF